MKKILIADDDRVWTEFLGTVLRKKGFDVITAFDGVQATMSAMQRQPDLIVLDIQMPGGTGLDALKRIKMSTKTAAIPIVVVSGTKDPNAARTVAALGVPTFLTKPTTAQQVEDVVCGLLGVG
jgi:two-component system response regulator VicR